MILWINKAKSMDWANITKIKGDNMKIKTKVWEKVTVWQENTIIVDVDSVEQFKQLVKEGSLISECNDIEFIDSELDYETLDSTGEYDYCLANDYMEVL